MYVKDPLCPHVSVEPPDVYDSSAWEMDQYELPHAEYEPTTVQDVYESVDTNLWLADAYRKQRAFGLARECERAACHEWQRFEVILAVYAGPDFANLVKRIAARLKRYDRARARRA